MDRSCIISLIKTTRTQDKYGVWRGKETSRNVYANARSITRSEFFDAGRAGLNPEWEFSLFAGDYEGEDTVEFNGRRYGVYRTYQRGTDIIELYVERKGGTNGN